MMNFIRESIQILFNNVFINVDEFNEVYDDLVFMCWDIGGVVMWRFVFR